MVVAIFLPCHTYCGDNFRDYNNHSRLLVVWLFYKSVCCRVGENHRGLKLLGLLEIHQGIRHDDNQIVNLYFASSSSVKADATCSTLALDDVGLQALTVIDVEYLNLLAFNHTCGVHQILVNGDTTHIVKIRLSNSDAMNLRL